MSVVKSEQVREQEIIRKLYEVKRRPHLTEKVVFVDGQAGCGKTMLAPIVSAFDRVELLTYAYEIEHACSLRFLKKMDEDAAIVMVRMLTDLQLYNTMMGRETNVRPSDLSSIFMDVNPWRYIKRFFRKGDFAIPQYVKNEKPILHLTTHNLLGISGPVFKALGDRAVLVEVVRHPLYMIKQHELNMEHLIEDVRDFSIYYRHADKYVPIWAHGWEEDFVSGNNTDKVIYSIKNLTRLTERTKIQLRKKYQAQIITVPFENFVLDPWPYMEQMKTMFGSDITRATLRMMKKQNVPRKLIADGIGLPVYKRCGWVPPESGSDENKEFSKRWKMVAQSASTKALQQLRELCIKYEKTYLGGEGNYDRSH